MDQNTALLATAAAIAVGAGVIYRAVTLQQAGRRRRDAPDQLDTVRGRLQDLVMLGKSDLSHTARNWADCLLGLENIEEYINAGDTGDNIDIHEYINHFSNAILEDYIFRLSIQLVIIL